MSDLIEVLIVFWVFGTIVLLLVATAIFGTAYNNDDRNNASKMARIAFYWPLWIAGCLIQVLRWKQS